jgi:CBS domain containing-hemolysin-like protein
MAGLVFGALGRAPEVGDEVRTDGLRLSVLEIEGSRIMKIEVEFGVDDAPTDEPAAA